MAWREVGLINPPYEGIEDDALEENLGLSYLAGYLLARDVDTAVYELTGKGQLPEKLAKIKPAAIIGISLYSTAIKSAKIIIDHLHKSAPETLIYLGGPHPTALPEQTLQAFNVDGVVVGEGEQAIYSIVLAARTGKPLRGVIQGKAVQNLDELPFPSRGLVDRSHFTRRLSGEACISMLSSRGCPHRCLHCNSIIMAKGDAGVRFRSTANILAEIRALKRLGYHNIRFNDDNFTANPNLPELLSAIAAENIKFRIFGRVEHLHPEICRLLAVAGCQMFSVGIESFNPDNLRFLRKFNMQDHFENLHTAREKGIAIRASFMVGLPYDTDERIEIDFGKAARLGIDEFAVYGLIPYPGTMLFHAPEKYHYYITDYNFSEYKQIGHHGDSCFVLGYNDGINAFTPKDVRRWFHRANELLCEHVLHMKNSPVG